MTENRAPPTRKATLLLLAAGVAAVLVTLGIDTDVAGLLGSLVGR